MQNGPVVSEKIWFEVLYVHDLGPRARNDLDLQYSHTFMKSTSCLYLPTFSSQASIVSEKSTVFTFPCRKIGQGHSRFIIYTIYDEQESPMLHTKFRRNRPADSGEEDCLRFLPYMGMAAILSCGLDHLYKLSFPHPKIAPHKIGFHWSSGFRGEDL